MRLRFTKMQGAGNDFVVLDETHGRLQLSGAQYRWLADRHFGVGADQILSVRAAEDDSVDFQYVIHNADGAEVEHCGNGARCFVRYVRDRGLTDKTSVRVRTVNRVLTLVENPDGRITVDMGPPDFDLARVPFEPAGLGSTPVADGWALWQLPVSGAVLPVAVLSMGNPHAVTWVEDSGRCPVGSWGPQVEAHPAFPRRVNAGFAQVLDRSSIHLRVYERGAGETLACGTGACAAAVAGIRLGYLDARVDVFTRGGRLTIEWQGGAAPVLMTGPAESVYEAEIDVPEHPQLP